MATPAFSLRHRDSKTHVTAKAQPNADNSLNRQQGSQNYPRIQSRDQPSSQSHWRSADLSEDTQDSVAHRERLEVAESSVRSVRDRLSSICEDKELDIDRMIQLFADIKQAEKRGDIHYLRVHSPKVLNTLSSSLFNFLRRFSADIESDKFSIASLNANDIHLLFNGLSVITGESLSNSLLSASDFHKSRPLLGSVTESMLSHASKEKMFEKSWDSSQLINGLNWLSRGLKQGIFSASSHILRQTYEKALQIMHTWTAGDDEHARPSTLVAPLDTRQLGKCMVQISTVMKYSLIDIEEQKTLLSDLVLGLTNGAALNEFKLWKKDVNNHQRTLTVAPVEGAVVTNISNAIKDCLGAGVLQPEDQRVQTLVSQLCRYMQFITDKDLAERNGQRLGNCCNFLRIVFEIEQRSGTSLVKDRNTYEQICSRMLGQISLRVKEFSRGNKVEQSIANLFSFVKAMDRTRSHSGILLNDAVKSLTSALLGMLSDMTSKDSVSATLGALHHFHMRHLGHAQTVYDLMISLLGKPEPKNLSSWSPQAQSMLMRTIVYCLNEPEALREFPDVRDSLSDLMQTLFDIGSYKDDLLPYLKAALIFITMDEEWIMGNQELLGSMLPKMHGKMISVDDLRKAVEQLQLGETPVVALPEPERRLEPVTIPVKKLMPANQNKSTTERLPVGMTRLVQPASVTTTSTGALTTAVTTTKKSEQLNNLPAVEWQQPVRVAKASRKDIRILPSTEPELVARSNGTAVTGDVTDKRPSHSNTTSRSTESKQKKPTTAVTGSHKQVKLAPDQEWFQLLKKEGPLSALQQKRLEELLKVRPALAMSTEGKGSKARSALFYAISTGKAAAVRLIMDAGDKKNLHEILIQVFDETMIVGSQELEALKVFLSRFSNPELEKLRKLIEEKYSTSGILKNIPSGFLNILQTFGLNFKENEKQTDNSSKNAVKFSSNKPSRKLGSDPGVNERFGFNDIPEIGRELVQAAHLGNTEKVIALLKTDSADKQALTEDHMGANALLHASGNGHVKVVKALKKMKSIEQQTRSSMRRTGANALMAAASNNHPEVVRELLTLASAEAMVKKPDYHGMNALMRAARTGAVKVVELLRKMDSGADQALAVDSLGNNALLYATRGGYYEVVKELLEMDSADDQAAVRNRDGMNALMVSAILRHPDIVDLLVNMKSGEQQALSRDNDGKNALMLAAEKGHAEIVEMLLTMDSAQEQAAARNNNDRSALECALIDGQIEVFMMLTEFLRRE